MFKNTLRKRIRALEDQLGYIFHKDTFGDWEYARPVDSYRGDIGRLFDWMEEVQKQLGELEDKAVVSKVKKGGK